MTLSLPLYPTILTTSTSTTLYHIRLIHTHLTIMHLTTVLFMASSLATMALGAADIMECHKPALLSNCKKVCDCPGDAWNGNVRPDCSLPICHDYCLCYRMSMLFRSSPLKISANFLTADPPPRYKSPSPGHRRRRQPESEPFEVENGYEY